MKTVPTLKAPLGLEAEWNQVLALKGQAAAEFVNKSQVNGIIEPKVNFIFTHAILGRIEGVLQEALPTKDFEAIKVKAAEIIKVPTVAAVLADKAFLADFKKANMEALAQIVEAKAANVDVALVASWEAKITAKAEVEALKLVQAAKAKVKAAKGATEYVEDAVYRHRLVATLIAAGAVALAKKAETKTFWNAILASKEGLISQAKNSSGAYVEGVKNGTIVPAGKKA